MSRQTKNATCTIEGCSGKHFAHGLCSKHYQKYRLDKMKTGEWDAMKRGFREVCNIPGCEDKHLAQGLCQKHYSAMIREKNRQFIIARYFLNGIRCQKCGKEFPLGVIDAHHPDPSIKEWIMSEVLNNSALQERPVLLAELDQCQMLCARCHGNAHNDPKLSHEESYSGTNKKKGRQIDRRKQMIREKYGEKCFQCKDWLFPKEMSFHHRDPSEKVDTLSDMLRMASKEKIMTEVAKCDILCRVCHRLRHLDVA
jgi:hypothetical protein